MSKIASKWQNDCFFMHVGSYRLRTLLVLEFLYIVEQLFVYFLWDFSKVKVFSYGENAPQNANINVLKTLAL